MTFVARAPGRVNLIGEHTDYNEGFVLPIAIDRAISIRFEPTYHRRVDITLAATGESDGFDLDAVGPPTGTWIDYIAGTAWSMLESGLPVRGFHGMLESDLPQGSGLASSAALELASALAMSGGGDHPIDRMTLARTAQRAENDYVGVSCGLMDQFASAFGREGAALMLDCRSLEYREVPLSLDDVALVVADSGSSRRLEGSAYNERRWQCETVAAMLGADSLRDVTVEMLDAAGDLDPTLARRARHVISENDRVIAAVAAFEDGDFDRVGRLFNETHASLRDLFEVSSPELDALVEIANAVPGVFGTRLTGAGFGGCTITLVQRGSIGSLTKAIEEQYPVRTGLKPQVFEVRPARGAEVIRAEY